MDDGDNVDIISPPHSFHFETLAQKAATCPYSHLHTFSTCSVVCGTSSTPFFWILEKSHSSRRRLMTELIPHTMSWIECQVKMKDLLSNLFLNTTDEPIKTRWSPLSALPYLSALTLSKDFFFFFLLFLTCGGQGGRTFIFLS